MWCVGTGSKPCCWQHPSPVQEENGSKKELQHLNTMKISIILPQDIN